MGLGHFWICYELCGPWCVLNQVEFGLCAFSFPFHYESQGDSNKNSPHRTAPTLSCKPSYHGWIPENLEAGDAVPPQRGNFTIPVHYAHRYIRSHKHAHTYLYMVVQHMGSYKNKFTCTHPSSHTHWHSHRNSYGHTNSQIYTYNHMHTHVHSAKTYMHNREYIDMYTYKHKYVQSYTYMHATHMFIYIYLYMSNKLIGAHGYLPTHIHIIHFHTHLPTAGWF